MKLPCYKLNSTGKFSFVVCNENSGKTLHNESNLLNLHWITRGKEMGRSSGVAESKLQTVQAIWKWAHVHNGGFMPFVVLLQFPSNLNSFVVCCHSVLSRNFQSIFLLRGDKAQNLRNVYNRSKLFNNGISIICDSLSSKEVLHVLIFNFNMLLNTVL